jgi:hypothetical protein
MRTGTVTRNFWRGRMTRQMVPRIVRFPQTVPPWLLSEGRYFLELHPLARVRARESFDAFGVLAGRPGKPFSAFAGRDKLGGKE